MMQEHLPAVLSSKGVQSGLAIIKMLLEQIKMLLEQGDFTADLEDSL